MSKSNSLAFRLVFDKALLIAIPVDTESQHTAMIRAIEQHAGSSVVECGRCKCAGAHYSYPITLANGTFSHALVEGVA